MSLPVWAGGFPIILTATGAVSTGPCQLIGFYVNSTNAGTLVMRDGGASGTVLSGTITPAIGWHSFPAQIGTSLHATIAGTALNATFFFASGN